MKPSVQKLVGSVAQDAVSFLTDEAVHTIAYNEDAPGVNEALDALAPEFSPSMVDPQLMRRAIEKASNMGREKRNNHQECVSYVRIYFYHGFTFCCRSGGFLNSQRDRLHM